MHLLDKVRSIFVERTFRGDKLRLGDKWISVPRLTPELYKKTYDVVYRIPRAIEMVKGATDPVATLLGASEAIVDELVELCSRLSGLDEEYLHQNAELPDIIIFVLETLERTDWHNALKKYRALVAKLDIALERNNAND